MKPKYFVTVHGEFPYAKAHAYLVKNVGITRENIFIVEKGDVIALVTMMKRLSPGKVKTGNGLNWGLG